MTQRIITPTSAEEFDAVRELCWEYRTFLLGLEPEAVRVVQAVYPQDKYAQTLEKLETLHVPPDGATRLALRDGRPVGCGMCQRLTPEAAEIKRVFVRDEARGTGAGRAIVQALVDDCRSAGYKRILMDTGKPLVAAQNLYLSMGFHLRGPYQEIPEFARDTLVFFELDLR